MGILDGRPRELRRETGGAGGGDAEASEPRREPRNRPARARGHHREGHQVRRGLTPAGASDLLDDARGTEGGTEEESQLRESLHHARARPRPRGDGRGPDPASPFGAENAGGWE